MKKTETFGSIVDNEEVRRVRRSLQQKGYAHTNDVALGLPKDLHEYVDGRFFTKDLLGAEVEGVPLPDRTRCRDVVECRFKSDGVIFNEYADVPMRPVADAVIPRNYNRTYTLDTPLFVKWLATYVSLIPVAERQAHCTVGLEFLRTRSKVVGYRHQDNEDFVGIYVVAREAEGAVTSLHPISDPEETEFAVTLQPGELLIFRDRDFMHDATPLRPRFDGDQPHRDILAALMHYPTTYLRPAQ